MTQLTYNEAFDPYHATFRFLRLWQGCQFTGNTHFDMLRILDFYLLFPFRIQNMSFISSDRGWRKISKTYENRKPYGELPDDASIFSRMEPFQRAAATSLVEAKILSAESWRNNQISFAPSQLPLQLMTRCAELNESMHDVMKILRAIRENYPLLGPGGLKDRTKLLEFRYDSV